MSTHSHSVLTAIFRLASCQLIFDPVIFIRSILIGQAKTLCPHTLYPQGTLAGMWAGYWSRSFYRSVLKVHNWLKTAVNNEMCTDCDCDKSYIQDTWGYIRSVTRSPVSFGTNIRGHRGNKYKLIQHHCYYDLRKFNFTNRVIPVSVSYTHLTLPTKRIV